MHGCQAATSCATLPLPNCHMVSTPSLTTLLPSSFAISISHECWQNQNPHSPAKCFNACETRNSFCRSLSSVDFADQSAAEKLCDKLRRLGKWLFRVARNGVQHVWTCAGGAAVEDRKCTTGDPAKSEFLISNHFILRCSDNDALPHLTPGTNGFLHNLQ